MQLPPYESIIDGDLELRPPRNEDTEAYVRARADLLIGRFVGATGGPEDGRRWVAEALAATDRREFAIAENGAFVGVCRLYHVALDDGTGEIGYWVAPWGRGRRVATRATTALTGWAFRHGLGRLEILARPDNPASHRVALAAGYRWEGRRRGVEPGPD